MREIIGNSKIRKYAEGHRREDVVIEKVIHLMHRYSKVHKVTPES